MSKPLLRQHFSTSRKNLPLTQKEQFDQSICTQLFKLIEKENCRVVHTYLPVRSEINLFPLIEQLLKEKITVVCPKTLKNRQLEHLELYDLNNLETGLFKTQHPAEGKIYQGKYDLIIVPGLAFTTEGYRLGYGGGYYDTFLKDHPNALKIGAAYPFQLVEKLPVEEHDIQLNIIITT
ncbi:MAG: 5-formyltetrahydrofolate cyclo-ligase [Saprospiraceae bacterium]